MLKHYNIGTFNKYVIDGCITDTVPEGTKTTHISVDNFEQDYITQTLFDAVKARISSHWKCNVSKFIVYCVDCKVAGARKNTIKYVHINVYDMANNMLNMLKAEDFNTIVKDALAA